MHAVGVGSAYGVLEYCASKGNSVADEYISKVQLGTINNTTTGGTGYSDYTSFDQPNKRSFKHNYYYTYMAWNKIQ
jgi:hypothetical protein